jgi:hypothetical protein
MLRKRQSWTVVWEQPSDAALERDPFDPGRVKITVSDTGEVREVRPGGIVDVDATLFLTPMEGGWELLP